MISRIATIMATAWSKIIEQLPSGFPRVLHKVTQKLKIVLAVATTLASEWIRTMKLPLDAFW